ncbi:dienelactone hydrolase family protein [Micromonospora sp. NBRC 110038]|uniref:dienelactone hydrolase family protein n=1 Tax=Micromonospora sp. NBRC 110038 TaxID=1550034 RepID=UPI001E582C49|nr:alpha/beta hydrolase [Micromonospora sp. NBRC 110038]
MRIHEEHFTVDGVPAVRWTPPDSTTTGPRPLILIGHGGGQHKTAPAVVHRAHRFAASGFAAVAVDAPNHGDRPSDDRYQRIATEIRARADIGDDPAPLLADFQALVAAQTVPEWRAVLDHLDPGPVGYWGVSLGCGLGVPFVAAEPRVRAAVLGLGGASARAAAEAAARITVPVEFLVQWDDERVPRAQSLALFDAFGSTEKTLHANPGRHGDRLPEHELDSAVRFFTRHLTPPPH